MYYQDDIADNQNLGYDEAMPEQTIYNWAFVYPQNVSGAIMLILEALSGENEDRMFYTFLSENAPSEEDRQIIEGIRNDEVGHFQMFDQLYHELTGMTPPEVQSEEFTAPENYCDGLKRALIGEQNAVRKYRNILYALQNSIHINMLIEIITDEIRHGILYNYLYAKNACSV